MGELLKTTQTYGRALMGVEYQSLVGLQMGPKALLLRIAHHGRSRGHFERVFRERTVAFDSYVVEVAVRRGASHAHVEGAVADRDLLITALATDILRNLRLQHCPVEARHFDIGFVCLAVGPMNDIMDDVIRAGLREVIARHVAFHSGGLVAAC